ncbi:quinone-dependent dihydroorotate dehydrogenase [Yoonia sp. SS1-5]|uniref:Dihydroorotate dehydrogenase (quinone) n=1 Tax=Yoonia rhodophyticola TaxID=3137370 RepID=A0AAN0MDM1_9RHOB
MRLVEQLGLRALRQLDPERAHGIALSLLNAGLGPRGGPKTSSRLSTTIAGIAIPNPVGLAAGFDKNATALNALAKTGFGFLEVGAATPWPQPGNPKPRLFRLTQDQAAINRFGFNNDGMDAIAARLAARPKGPVIGLNLGANKDSADKADDFARVLTRCGPHVDFATVNVSSPNTEKLRDLQGKAALGALLDGVMDARAALAHPIPVFLKIAPDLEGDALAEIADVANSTGVAAIVATNTTLDRTGLQAPQAAEVGGLSGQPLFEKSTRVVAQLSTLTELPIIGVGGVGSAEQAYAKIRAGASAIQLYTALVYGGMSLVDDITHGLEERLAEDGFANIADAVGSGRADWL